MNVNDPDRPQFDQRVDYDIACDQPIIYLNRGQDAYLAKKEEEYRQRLTQDPSVRMDARIKLLIIFTLRSKGSVTLDDIIEYFTNDDIASCGIHVFGLLLSNAFQVIGSYNSGRKENLKDVHAYIPEPTKEQRRRVVMLMRKALDYEPMTNTPSPTEAAIGLTLRTLLQTEEERAANQAVDYPQERKHILDDVLRYFQTGKFANTSDAIEDLLHKLEGRVYVQGLQIGKQEMYGALYKLLLHHKQIREL